MPVDDKRLAEALASGPFSLALRLALRSSGLSLDRIQVRLRERDAPVSKTALSNWQSGRTQPERAESLRALAALEGIVGVPDGALAALLGPPRPRGRWVTQSPGDMRADQAWARPDGLSRALLRMGSSVEALSRLAKVSAHVVGYVDGDGVTRAFEHHLILRAEVDGVDRHTTVHRGDDRAQVTLGRCVGCRLGRQREDPETGFTIFELILDRPLRLGEHVAIGYTVHTAHRDGYYSHRVGTSVRTLSLQIRFETLPVRVYRLYLPSIGEPGRERTDLPLGASFTAQHTAVDPAPGIHRIYWEWD